VTTTSNPTSERDGAIADHAQDLLKLTLRYTGRGPTGGDPTSRNAHYFTAINSWTAYRLLRALQQVDPDLLRPSRTTPTSSWKTATSASGRGTKPRRPATTRRPGATNTKPTSRSSPPKPWPRDVPPRGRPHRLRRRTPRPLRTRRHHPRPQTATGRSYGYLHRLLLEAGTTLRPRGRRSN
jgi:hypothetical protein